MQDGPCCRWAIAALGGEPKSDLFIDPQPVTIEGYDGVAMEPFISPDGRELYFTRASFPAGMRVMVATRAAEGVPFGEPRVLSALSGKIEAPSVSNGLKELFFHKDVAGSWKIFRARRNEAVLQADKP